MSKTEKPKESDFDPRCPNPENCTCVKCESRDTCWDFKNPESCCHECDST